MTAEQNNSNRRMMQVCPIIAVLAIDLPFAKSFSVPVPVPVPAQQFLSSRIQATTVRRNKGIRETTTHLFFNALPEDDMFYDGYDSFIRNLQEDLENKSFDMYDIYKKDDVDSGGINASVSSRSPSGDAKGRYKQNQLGKGKGSGRNTRRSQGNSLNALPQDDMVHDGYDEFIRNLQEDLDNESFNIYNNGDVNDGMTQERSGSPPVDANGRYKNNGNRNRNGRNTRRRQGYRRDPNDDMSIPVNEREVTRLIQLRSKAQQDRNYDLADGIRDELNNDHHVYVWDKDGLWSASAIAPSRRYGNKHRDNNGGGGRGGRGRGRGNQNRNRSPKQFGRNGHDYVQIGDGINRDECSLALHEIHSLLAKRLEFKLIRNYAQADAIQAQLYADGVKIHDKLKQWRADGGIFADVEATISGKIFDLNEYSEPIDDVEVVQEVEKLVNQRDGARAESNYGEADRLRNVLWEKYRVAVDDKSRTYSKGGDFGPNGTFYWTDNGPINPRRGHDPSLSKDYDWRAVGGMYTQSSLSEPLKDQNEEEVLNLIHDRLEAKRVRDFEVADLIRDHLYKEYQISVDDQLRQWSVGGDFEEAALKSLHKNSPTAPDGKLSSSYVKKYNRRGGTGELSEQEIQLVEALVARRAEELSRFNNNAASSIRKGLKTKYYVILDDVNCEWHVRNNAFILNPRQKSLPKVVEDSRTEIEKLLRERSQAKREKDFSRCDEIRADLLEAYNITLDDRLKEWSVIIENHDNADSVDEQTEIDDSESILSKLTVAELKIKLKAAGKPVSGRKADLIKRILTKDK